MNQTIKKETVGEILQHFYATNDFGEDGGKHQNIAWIKFGFFSIPIPNTEARKNNVYLHDVNHIVTGYPTTWKGETAISAWEIAAGGWKKLYFPWLLTLWAMGLGICFFTKSTIKAFYEGLTKRHSLHIYLTKSEMMQLSVSELKQRFQNHPNSHQNLFIWSIVSVIVFLLPIFVLISSCMFFMTTL
ncbi:MAG: hypothetical protein KA313_00735 [Pseudarcicella sp.]|nr:hypothetical protein [Pseudarcicella sp.]MBP6409605.1 hypothetical protein [Pseudarcicella sp.]